MPNKKGNATKYRRKRLISLMNDKYLFDQNLFISVSGCREVCIYANFC